MSGGARWAGPGALAGLLALLLGASPGLAQPGADVGECPVLPWETAQAEISLPDGAGGRLYFCCQRCRRDWLRGSVIPLQGAARDAALLGRQLDATLCCAAGSPEARGGWMDWLGRLHPVAVHFPIAFLLLAALAELAWVLTGRVFFREGARFNLLFGALSAPLAAATGWAAGGFVVYPGDLSGILSLHKWCGTSVALGAPLVAWLSERAQGREHPGRVRAYQAALFALAGLVAFTGYLGGLLVYGPDHYQVQPAVAAQPVPGFEEGS